MLVARLPSRFAGAGRGAPAPGNGAGSYDDAGLSARCHVLMVFRSETPGVLFQHPRTPSRKIDTPCLRLAPPKGTFC